MKKKKKKNKNRIYVKVNDEIFHMRIPSEVKKKMIEKWGKRGVAKNVLALIRKELGEF